MSKSTKIRLGLIDVDAKPNCSPEMKNIQKFSNINEIKSDFFELNDYATLEKNFFVLDGNKTLLQKNELNEGIGICSLEMSDENGNFNSFPILEILLANETTIGGLTFGFGKYDYCSNLDITYYLNNETVLNFIVVLTK